jgi:hypothetical protein
LKKEFPLRDTGVSCELHPETPVQAALLYERFKGHDLTSFYGQLLTRGEEAAVI